MGGSGGRIRMSSQQFGREVSWPNQKLHLTAAALREIRVPSHTSRRSKPNDGWLAGKRFAGG